jgi:tRNA(adenine34) deaminase
VLPDDEYWMGEALQLAHQAQAVGEVPVGAVIVSADNQLLGTGFNQVIQLNDPTAHAEMIALRIAAAKIGNYRLPQTTLYVTLEPCCMCAGAMVHARIQRLVFGATDPKTGAAGSVFHLLNGAPLNHCVAVTRGCLQDQCALILRRFFKERR